MFVTSQHRRTDVETSQNGLKEIEIDGMHVEIFPREG